MARTTRNIEPGPHETIVRRAEIAIDAIRLDDTVAWDTRERNLRRLQRWLEKVLADAVARRGPNSEFDCE